MNSPFISVIIPSFNRAAIVKRAIDSVLSQTFSDYELIIIDDGSTDETQAVLENYQNHSNITLLKQSNQGVSAARNLGVEHAQGVWLSFLDSDDQWLENKLFKQVHYLKENPQFKLIHGDEIWIRNGVRVNPKIKHKKGGGDQFNSSLKLCAISPSTVLLTKDLYQEFNGFRDDYPCCEDYDLWLKITSQNKIGYVDDFLIKKYGGHSDQLSQKYKAMDYWRVKSIDWVIQKLPLTKRQKDQALKVLLKKISILIKGYEKHQNLGPHYQEIKKLEQIYNS